MMEQLQGTPRQRRHYFFELRYLLIGGISLLQHCVELVYLRICQTLLQQRSWLLGDARREPRRVLGVLSARVLQFGREL